MDKFNSFYHYFYASIIIFHLKEFVKEPLKYLRGSMNLQQKQPQFS